MAIRLRIGQLAIVMMTQGSAECSEPPDAAVSGGMLPRWRNEAVARIATRTLSRLLALVACIWTALLLLAGLPGRVVAVSNPLFEVSSSSLVPAALALLTPALAGLAGAVLVSRARERAAGDRRLLDALPGASRFVGAHRIGQAARSGQIMAVAGPAAVCLAASWLLRGPNFMAPSLAAAATVCVGLAIIAFPLLIGERVLATTPAADLPEAPDLRSLLLLAVIGLPVTGLLLILRAAGLSQANIAVLVAAGLGTLVAGELAVRALLRAFLPPPDENAARAACRSLVATLLADGTRSGGIAASIRRHLGIDFARSWALSFVRAALPPLLLGLALLGWGLTGLVVVGPD